VIDARDLEEITRASASARERCLGAGIVPVDQPFVGYKGDIAILALNGRLPSMYFTPDDVHGAG
jgi:hypothetical protein